MIKINGVVLLSIVTAAALWYQEHSELTQSKALAKQSHKLAKDLYDQDTDSDGFVYISDLPF